MVKIWKYPLLLEPRQLIQVPRGSTPLTVQVQDNTPTLWCEVVDEGQPTRETWDIAIVGTGHALPVDCVRRVYLGTVQTPPFVWHVYLMHQT